MFARSPEPSAAASVGRLPAQPRPARIDVLELTAMGALVRFGTTMWSLIDCARAGDQVSLDRLTRMYRPAIVNFAGARGLPAEAAEDAAQEVLIRLLRILPTVDPRKGKFRSLVLSIACNVLHEWRRARSKETPLPLEVSAPEREEAFDRAWVRNIVLVALDRLREECEKRGTPFHRALQEQMAGASQEEIARRLGVEPSQVKSYVHQAREKVRRTVEAMIADTTAESEFEEERRYLLRLIDV